MPGVPAGPARRGAPDGTGAGPRLSQPLLLLADDNADHAFLLGEALEAADAQGASMVRVEHGQECLSFLRRQGSHARARRPDLLVLDLRMPCVDGFAVLEAMRADPALRDLPVLAWSTSTEQEDVQRMYALGCRSFVRKPSSFSGYRQLADLLVRHWLRQVVPPVPPAPLTR